MKTAKRHMPTLIVKNLAEYFPNFYIWLYTPFVITKDGGFYEYEGELIPCAQFEQMFPLNLESSAGKQLDGRTNWQR